MTLSLRELVRRRRRKRRRLGKIKRAIKRLSAAIALASATEGPTVMYDSTTPPAIPRDAEAVGGYTSGYWPTYPELLHLFPHARVLSIAINAAHDADVLDIENGDATIAEAPGWVKRQRGRGVRRPGLYISVASAQALLDELARFSIAPSDVKLWTAHYGTGQHLCTPARCGYGLRHVADATQWTNHALGRNLDQSLCGPGFFAN